MLHSLPHHIAPLFPNVVRDIRIAGLPNIAQIRRAQRNEAEGAMEEVGELQEVVTVRWALLPVLWHRRNGPLFCRVVGRGVSFLWPDLFRRHRPCDEGGGGMKRKGRGQVKRIYVCI